MYKIWDIKFKKSFWKIMQINTLDNKVFAQYR